VTSHPHWPLFDLRLRTADLGLQPVTEADLAPLTAATPADLELNPAATRYEMGEPANRAAAVHQGYWKAMGSWSPQAWELPFVVHHRGVVIGTQTVQAEDFLALRTVDSASWLVPSARGRGWGKQMRAAVLALAFDHLGAKAAITSAWHDNEASLGVSRSLGYRPNGESFLNGGHRVDTLVHLRMLREDWLRVGLGDGVQVTGVAPCLPFFGLGPGGGRADLGAGQSGR